MACKNYKKYHATLVRTKLPICCGMIATMATEEFVPNAMGTGLNLDDQKWDHDSEVLRGDGTRSS